MKAVAMVFSADCNQFTLRFRSKNSHHKGLKFEVLPNKQHA